MTKSFDDLFDELMKDPQIKAEYEALEPEFETVNTLINMQSKKTTEQSS